MRRPIPWSLLPLVALGTLLVLAAPGRRDASRTGPAPASARQPHPPAGVLEAPAALPAPPAEARSGRREVANSLAEGAPAAPAEERASALPVDGAPERTAEANLVLRVVDAATRRPVPGAVVEWRHAPHGGGERLATGVAGRGGELSLRLPAGELTAVAWSGRAAGGPAAVELASGALRSLEVALEPTCEVAGRVVDAHTGAPVPGARVSFWTFAEEDRVRTDSDGVFRHPRFPAGAFAQQVRVEAEGYGPAVRYLEVDERGRWSLPAASAGEPGTSGANVPWLEIALVAELVVRGRVVDPEGAPVAGAEVVAEGYFRVLPSVASRDAARATSDAAGSFELRGLRSDVGHGVALSAEGYARRNLELAPSRETDVSLGAVALEPERAVAGVVLDPAGRPAADLVVELELEDEDADERAAAARERDVPARVETRTHRARTTPEGTFLFEGLREASFRLVVRRDRGPLVERRLSAAEVAAGEGLVLELPADTLTLAGIVRDGRGAVEGAVVEVTRSGLVGRVRTDAQGRFRLAGLDDAEAYEIAVSAPPEGQGPPLTGSASAWAYTHPTVLLAAR